MAGNGNSGGHNAKTVSRLTGSGTYREDRHSGFHNMRHVPGRPETPKDLKGDALEEYERMLDRMEEAGSLSKIDDAVVYQYAKLYSEILRSEQRMSSIVKNIDKMVAASNRLDGEALVEAMRQIAGLEKVLAGYDSSVRQGRTAIRQYLVELGMTSSARGRIRMPGESQRPAGKLTAFRGGKSNAQEGA